MAAAGCAQEPVEIQLFHLNLDVIASSSSLDVLTNGSDIGGCTCKETTSYMLAVDSCAFDDDVLSCDCDGWSSCLTEVRVRGVEGTVEALGSIGRYTANIEGLTHPVLVLSGCGEPSVEIPLDGPRPSPTLLAASLGPTHIDAAWVPTSEYAYVSAWYGTELQRCLVTSRQHRFDVHVPWAPRWASLSASMLAAPTDVELPNGHARLWPSSDTATAWIEGCPADDLLCTSNRRQTTP